MNYYLLSAVFEPDEASFTEQQPQQLNFYHTEPKSFETPPIVGLDTFYTGRAMSDFLKLGIGLLASEQVQQIFLENQFSGLQFVPVEVHADTVYHSFAFMNCIADYDLLDPVASNAKRFKEVIGGYAKVSAEKLDKHKFSRSAITHDCFTLSNYKLVYYVNERVKLALERAGISGIAFIPADFATAST
ncbi:hypothetical protein [Shewanella fidelis]|uniref:Uncharacterized protein n=1 Tax=Shewanella fidelis TaxID=173509 RepID=A0AAW8NUL8_9GAMM|nr:hypothetical protein [Shewanella fidelis]MDR8525654.1 hypothetical protein [Shewanella fidelis]MDW4812836.1 hypothetical protein [Shewanella fidelis]MDW4816584.1 hypothetical protein [Shewanella fidelis]MDW4820252.1 hypothetical protein [Shewanella fidelis]MDW4825301.1 hypothetical protein [Shewanella fidelis]